MIAYYAWYADPADQKVAVMVLVEFKVGDFANRTETLVMRGTEDEIEAEVTRRNCA